MPEVQQCAKCGRIIESGEVFVRFKNPNPNQPPLFFHHRGGGNCYWEYLRDQVLKVQITAVNTFNSPLDIEIKNSGSASSSRGDFFLLLPNGQPGRKGITSCLATIRTGIATVSPFLSVIRRILHPKPRGQRVVTLNAERAREEQNGNIRWLRPEYQQPQAIAVQTGLGITEEQVPAAVRATKLEWPAGLSEQVQLVKDSLRSNQMLGVDEVASRFIRARRTRVQEILETLTALGQIRRVNDRYLI